jgi:hypothetical protein
MSSPKFKLVSSTLESNRTGLELKHNNFIKESNAKKQELTNNISKLNIDKNKLKVAYSQLTDITKVISGFQTPVGNLAIGFDYLVVISPIALVSGYVVCISILIGAMRIRKDYASFLGNADRRGHDLTKEDIAISAPLWIDPEDPKQNKMGRWGGLQHY